MEIYTALSTVYSIENSSGSKWLKPAINKFDVIYRISSYKTRGYYFFTSPSIAGIIRMRVLFEGWYYFLKGQILKIKTRIFLLHT